MISNDTLTGSARRQLSLTANRERIEQVNGPDLTAMADRSRRLRFAVIVLTSALLAGCSLPIADLPVVGLPANAPARPEPTGVYPAVHDVPAPREQAVLEPEERARIEKELVAARDRQTRASGAGDGLDASKSAKKKSSQTN